MRKIMAALGSLIFFIVAPGFVAGVVPWWLTRWRLRDPFTPWLPFRAFGALLIVCGTGVLLHAFWRFVAEGIGTPAPVAPPRHLVVGGLYQHVRNPMYLAVLAIIVGQSFALGELRLLFYAGAVFALFAAFVHGYEEPALRRRFGPEYDLYCRDVPAWWPRLRQRPPRGPSRT